MDGPYGAWLLASRDWSRTLLMSFAQAKTSTPAAPPAPAIPPSPAVAARPVVNVASADGAVKRFYTTDDIAALKARKSELSTEIGSANSRRREVQNELRRAVSPADRTGLEQRLGVLDARIAHLEHEIDENSSQLASLPAQMVSSAGEAPHLRTRTINSNMPTPIGILLGFIAAVALGAARGLFRHSRPAAPGAAHDAERLERMERSMDAIAIEIERVSEGQRFVTRLMSERGGALDAGQAPMEPVRLGDEQLVEPE